MAQNHPVESLGNIPSPQRQSHRPADIDSLLCMEDVSSTAIERQDGHKQGDLDWKPGKSEYAVMVTIAVVSLMVALDATILVSVLPV